jgi:hypothetical protein
MMTEWIEKRWIPVSAGMTDKEERMTEILL